MINLPPTAQVNRPLAKERFYQGVSGATKLKELFTRDVERIRWGWKLSPKTVNFTTGGEVPEVEIFETTLSARAVDERIVRAIDAAVKVTVLHVFTTARGVEAWFGYRLPDEKMRRYYHRAWRFATDFDLDLSANSADALCVSILRQLSENRFEAKGDDTLKTALEKDARRIAKEKQLAALKRKFKSERQMNRKYEIGRQIKELEKGLS